MRLLLMCIGKVERYHAPLRRAYKIFRDEGESPTVALQLAVKAINDTAGPDGLVPTLLVFGAYPRIADSSLPSLLITKRAETVKKAIEAGPYRLIAVNGTECTVEFPRGLRTFRSTVVKPYYYEEPEDCEGNAASEAANERPLENNNNNDEGPTPSNDEEEDELAAVPAEKVLDTIVVRTPLLRRRPGRPRKYNTNFLDETGLGAALVTAHWVSATCFLSLKEESDLLLVIDLRKKGIITTLGKPFEHAVKLEIDALIARGVFRFVKYDKHLYAGQQIFKARIVNKVKGTDNQPYKKSRLVVQGYADDGKEAILTQSPTIQQASQQLILALALSLLLKPGFVVWL
ncbi:hypothetical protein CSUB01_12252 [Colletotrichum sublineola]|uniref:Uncharacterized protein n=1 Tax=Colletotrichum sublineola TaxID=1173701 RepID=A0A066XJ40_COLSU|nr:hypothetical protein CSUB01_12252 [Colletotrichum sublineola]